MTGEKYSEITANFAAACVLMLRQNTGTPDQLREALEQVLHSLVTSMANVVMELDRHGCGNNFLAQLDRHFLSAVEATVVSLRDFRARYHDKTETVN